MTPLRRAALRLAFTAAAVMFAVAPSLSRWDVYACLAMGTTHLGECCGGHVDPPRADELGPEAPVCCVVRSEGSTAPPASSGQAALIAMGTPSLVLRADLSAPSVAPASVERLERRSRAPPGVPLFVRHQTFLL